MWAMIGCSIAMAIWTAGIVWMSAREQRLATAIPESIESGNDTPAMAEAEKV